MKKISILFTLLAMVFMDNNACTNFLVTRGASTDGSNFITYLADSHVLYGELYFSAAKDHKDGEMIDIFEWDTHKYLGKIEQVPHTYQTIGNINEHQLAIGETTYGGRKELRDTTGIMDYGSLIYITLQRAKTAREAINIIDKLLTKYGYYSSGESFSISDKNEVWIMEMISKGMDEKGAVWVARKIPNGYVSAHANQARITTFPLDDKENCLYSKDVITFARDKGWYKGEDKNFSFSDTYCPVDFGGARFCDARAWSFFKRITDGMDKYADYALGKVIKEPINGYATNRMPLWVKPTKKLSVQDIMHLMRDHFEGTALDMSKDAGAGAFNDPYRWRPLTWEVDSVTYCNERAISTQQTGFSFIAQSRKDLPDAIGGILWFGVDDSYTTCYTPIYCSSTETPTCFKVGNGDLLTYSETSAFWTFNTVANFAYTKYSYMVKDIQIVQNELETSYIKSVKDIDKMAKRFYKKSKKDAIKYLTKFSVSNANKMTHRWKDLRNYLLIKYVDGNVKKEENGKFKTNGNGVNMPVFPSQPGYSKEYYKKVVESTGDHLKVLGNDKH